MTLSKAGKKLLIFPTEIRCSKPCTYIFYSEYVTFFEQKQKKLKWREEMEESGGKKGSQCFQSSLYSKGLKGNLKGSSLP